MVGSASDVEAIRRLYGMASKEFDQATERAAEASARVTAARQKLRALEATMRAFGLLDEEGDVVTDDEEAADQGDEEAEEERPQIALREGSQNGSVDWGSLSRAAAIRYVLRSEGPMTPTEIARALAKRGREGDSARYVSASLQRQGEYRHVEAIGDGKWKVLMPADNEKN